MSTPDFPLRNQVAAVERVVVNVDRNVHIVSEQVNAVSAAQHETRSNLNQLWQEFRDFATQSVLQQNVQLAETRTTKLRNQLQRDFGHHDVVRRSATGMLQAFDRGLVSEEVVRNVSEQLMVQTPRYWLAPALVGLSAWAADDEALAQRAVDEAFRRSPSKTSLFFALITRRQHRADSSMRWLDHYLRNQDPLRLGRDFAVILESVSQGAFGVPGRRLAQQTMDSWRQILVEDERERAQLDQWYEEIRTFRADTFAAKYPRLVQLSPQWPQLDDVLRSASAHAPLLNHYESLMGEEVSMSAGLEDAVDDILDRLVEEYDEDELPIRRELTTTEAVVAYGGDHVAAMAAADRQNAALEATLDYLTIQTASALNPGAIGVSRATQQLSIAACRDYLDQAHGAYTMNYRQQFPEDVTVGFSYSYTIGAHNFELPEWTGSLYESLGNCESSLAGHWDENIQPYLRSLRFNPIPQVVLGVLITVAALLVGELFYPIVGVILALVAAGIFGYRIYRRYAAAARAFRQAAANLEAAKTDSIMQLRAAAAEFRDFQDQYAVADRGEQAVQRFVGQLEQYHRQRSPRDGREVETEGWSR